MNFVKKHKHSRLALLIVIACAVAVGYACGARHGTAADDQSKASRAPQQAETRMWSV